MTDIWFTKTAQICQPIMIHRYGGQFIARSALLRYSRCSFLAISDSNIFVVPATKRRVTGSEVSRILYFLRRRSIILDFYYHNLLGGRNSTIASQEQTRSVTLTPIINSFADRTSTDARAETYTSRITVTSSLKSSNSGGNC